MYNPLTAFLSSSTSRAATSALNYPRSIDPRTANSSSHSHLANRRTERILLLSQKMLKRVEGVKLALRLDRIVVTERTRPWRARARAFVTVHSNALQGFEG